MVAQRAGLTTPPFRQTAGDPAESGYCSLAPEDAPVKRLIVLHDATFGAPAPARVQRASAELARLAGAQMLGVDFFESPDDPWTFAFATPMPELQLGGAPLLRALATRLSTGGHA
jgi:hypothetical protein